MEKGMDTEDSEIKTRLKRPREGNDDLIKQESVYKKLDSTTKDSNIEPQFVLGHEIGSEINEQGCIIRRFEKGTCYYKDGVIHREDGPALETPTRKYWLQHGKIFRTDNGAHIEDTGGDKLWVNQNGKPYLIEDSKGVRKWYCNTCCAGLLHREDGPAVEQPNGRREWWIHGKIKRNDGGPTIEDKVSAWHNKRGQVYRVQKEDGRNIWYCRNSCCHNLKHRLNGPAVELPDGERQWWFHGFLHRLGAPAIEKQNADKEWFCNGLLHRTDGPAIENADGTRYWYQNGCLWRSDGGPTVEDAKGNKWWTTSDGKTLRKSSKGRDRWFCQQGNCCSGALHRVDGPAIEWTGGRKEWWIHGKKHREGGPAIELPSGEREYWICGVLVCKEDSSGKYYYKNGLLHREEGPSIERKDGTREWHMDGKRHRLLAPAIEYPNGEREWWVKGKRHQRNGPAVERTKEREWWINGKRHRSDGPALELADGTRKWYQFDLLHRPDGPAVEYPDGTKEWWIRGEQVTSGTRVLLHSK